MNRHNEQCPRKSAVDLRNETSEDIAERYRREFKQAKVNQDIDPLDAVDAQNAKEYLKALEKWNAEKEAKTRKAVRAYFKNVPSR